MVFESIVQNQLNSTKSLVFRTIDLPGEAQPRSPQPDPQHPDSVGSDDSRHYTQSGVWREKGTKAVGSMHDR
jgi:hypothetical protein